MSGAICSGCGSTGPFYLGITKWCKECWKAKARANRAAKIEYYRAYDRVRFYENGARGTPSKEAVKRRQDSWKSRNSEKRSVHVAVGHAIRAGRIVKADQCETCGTTVARLHGHHDDYSKPLDVRWLCSKCHRAWHRKYDEEESRRIVEQHRNKAS